MAILFIIGTIVTLLFLVLLAVTIVLLFLINDKARRIEQRLDRLDQGPKRFVSE